MDFNWQGNGAGGGSTFQEKSAFGSVAHPAVRPNRDEVAVARVSPAAEPEITSALGADYNANCSDRLPDAAYEQPVHGKEGHPVPPTQQRVVPGQHRVVAQQVKHRTS